MAVDLSEAELTLIDKMVAKQLESQLKQFEETMSMKIDELNRQLTESKKEVRQIKCQLAETDLKLDDLEQYTRRTNIRIEGLAFTKGESNVAIRNQVIEHLAKTNVVVSKNDIMRCHRSSKPKEFKGKTTAQTIVRFNSWETRRMCHSLNKVCKNKVTGFRVYQT